MAQGQRENAQFAMPLDGQLTAVKPGALCTLESGAMPGLHAVKNVITPGLRSPGGMLPQKY